MAEVRIQVIAEDKATPVFNTVEKATVSAIQKVGELGSAFKRIEASSVIFRNPEFWKEVIKLVPTVLTTINLLREKFKDTAIEKTLKSTESAFSALKTPFEELSNSMKNLSENLAPVKEHFESINHLIKEIKSDEKYLKEVWKSFELATGANVDYSELLKEISGPKKELSYRTGYQPSSFESLNTGAMRELYDMAKKPMVLNLNPENFFHNLQTAYDVFRDMRSVFEEPIALTLDVSSALSAIDSVKSALSSIPDIINKYIYVHTVYVGAPAQGEPKHGGAYYIPSTGLYPLLQGEAVLNRAETKNMTSATNNQTINYSPQITISNPSGDIRDLERMLIKRMDADRNELGKIGSLRLRGAN